MPACAGLVGHDALQELEESCATLAALADDETIGARRHGLWEALATHCNALGSFDLEAATCS
ncbi:MAG: hypothetical protein F4X84_02580 [Synechococcus sp. SB0662_bin_45]|nr:hypothetical protein [Synechococcus sp. SB0662_bin_45]